MVSPADAAIHLVVDFHSHLLYCVARHWCPQCGKWPAIAALEGPAAQITRRHRSAGVKPSCTRARGSHPGAKTTLTCLPTAQAASRLLGCCGGDQAGRTMQAATSRQSACASSMLSSPRLSRTAARDTSRATPVHLRRCPVSHSRSVGSVVAKGRDGAVAVYTCHAIIFC